MNTKTPLCSMIPSLIMLEDILQIGEVYPWCHFRLYDGNQTLPLILSGNTPLPLRKSPIKKYLRRLDKAITREIIKLQKSIDDDTYKNESNYRIKLRRLEEYREKRDTLINNIYTLYKIPL
ncbi:MAG: hypothetical protein KatS3mg027_1343 [Bacteroidia bacterium]|nr:MAG: hypothetical protein KatS3mg027_1343 [Bacteroidia bacterium]